ncbi:MAG: DUF3291 domain-containing protein [Enterobacterales bacterium]|nr:DUF3291 domain-containing protein [Enterobacterales bacterium]
MTIIPLKGFISHYNAIIIDTIESMNRYHLAQINIAQAKDSMQSPVMDGFVKRLDEINQLAEQSEGFIWRLKTEQGDATGINAFEDDRLIINLSLWNNLDSLKHYVYQSVHIDLIQDKKHWFNKIKPAHLALWWIPEGCIPSIEQGKQKLQYLQNHGASASVFTFAKPYPHPETT